jgi:hypothetical protein
MLYQIVGNQAILEWTGTTGTSNATYMDIGNVPSVLMPLTRASAALGTNLTVVIDSGAAAGATANFSTLSTLQFNKGTAPPSATGFTNSGTKGLDTGWSMTYFLR